MENYKQKVANQVFHCYISEMYMNFKGNQNGIGNMEFISETVLSPLLKHCHSKARQNTICQSNATNAPKGMGLSEKFFLI